MGVKEFLKPSKGKILTTLFILIFVFDIVIVLEGPSYMETSICKLSDPPVCAFNAMAMMFFAHYFVFLFYVVSIPMIIIYWFLHRREESPFDYIMEGIYGFFIALLSFIVLIIILVIWEIISLAVLNFRGKADLVGDCIITPILGILGIIKGYRIYKNTNKLRWKYATIFSAIFIAIIFSILILFLITTPSTGTVKTSPYQVICVADVVFNIESVCKSRNDYKISIKNGGSKDIVKWRIWLREDESNIEVIDSNEGIRAFGVGQITVIPSKINELRKVEAIPIIKIADKEITCAQNIDFYGDVEGVPITEECNK